MSDEADYAGEAQARNDADLSARLERERLAREAQVGTTICIDCEDEIPAGRRKATPWVKRCVECQEFADQQDRRRR